MILSPRQWIRLAPRKLRFQHGFAALSRDGMQCLPDDFPASFDDALRNPLRLLKDSRSTTAARIALPDGETCFLKRTNNKGFRFTCRYLFRPARAFRAAAAASAFRELGIRTPAVLCAAEVRKHRCLLQAGFLLTESQDAWHGMEAPYPPEIFVEPLFEALFSFLVNAAKRLHAAGLIHGDMKLHNVYEETPGIFGLWDLDGVRYFKRGVPMNVVARELARIISSLLLEFSGTDLPETQLDKHDLTLRVLNSYRDGNDLPAPEPSAILRELARFLE